MTADVDVAVRTYIAGYNDRMIGVTEGFGTGAAIQRKDNVTTLKRSRIIEEHDVERLDEAAERLCAAPGGRNGRLE